MTAEIDADPHPELTPLADYLAGVLRRLRPLPPLDLDLTQAYGNVLAEDVRRAGALPAFDQAAIDGYAARWEDTRRRRSRGRDRCGSTWSATWARRAGGRSGSPPAPASRSRPARRCRSTADVVVPVHWTDQGMAAVEIRTAQAGVRRPPRRRGGGRGRRRGTGQSFNTKLFRSACERPSRSAGGDIPRMNLTLRRPENCKIIPPRVLPLLPTFRLRH